VAWFAGLALIDGLRQWRWTASAFLTVTGALLFAANPARTYASTSFQIKMALLATILLLPARTRRWKIALWIAVILASRGIAYF
jgi:hypothetical protein